MFSFGYLGLFAALLVGLNAQCPGSASSTGPCVNGANCSPGSTCAADGINCCPTTPTCVDLTGANGISSCPGQVSYCNNPAYYTLMTQQCPKTCNRCPTVSATCADLTAANGVSNCASVKQYCNAQAYPTYATLMQQQCPKTCGFCTTGR